MQQLGTLGWMYVRGLTVVCPGREGGHGISEYMNEKLIAFGGL